MFYIKGQAVITLGKLSWYHFLYRTQTYHCLVGSRLASQVEDDTDTWREVLAATGGGTSKGVAERRTALPVERRRGAAELPSRTRRRGERVAQVRNTVWSLHRPSHFVDGGSLSLLPSFISKSSTFFR
jgi:hypothetical protein